MVTFTKLSAECKELVQKLSWQTYHTPENLASLLVGEVGELSEICVWLTKEQINQKLKAEVKEELADVVKGTIFLYNSLNLPVSLETLIVSKLDYESRRYPISKYKNKSKYEKLTPQDNKHVKPLMLPKRNILKKYTITEIEKIAWKKTIDRKWNNYYTPATLCLGIFENCSKIYSSFQRRTTNSSGSYEKLVWSIAGILILCMRFHKYMELEDLGKIVLVKINNDFKRFFTK